MTIKLHSKAMARLLKQDARPIITSITNDIARAAGEGFDGDVQVGRSRVRGVVGTVNRKGRQAEAEDRTLSRALNAGRR